MLDMEILIKNNAILVLALLEGHNGVNRQMAKKLTVNRRQKRKIFRDNNHQMSKPTDKPSNVSRSLKCP